MRNGTGRDGTVPRVLSIGGFIRCSHRHQFLLYAHFQHDMFASPQNRRSDLFFPPSSSSSIHPRIGNEHHMWVHPYVTLPRIMQARRIITINNNIRIIFYLQFFSTSTLTILAGPSASSSSQSPEEGLIKLLHRSLASLASSKITLIEYVIPRFITKENERAGGKR